MQWNHQKIGHKNHSGDTVPQLLVGIAKALVQREADEDKPTEHNHLTEHSRSKFLRAINQPSRINASKHLKRNHKRQSSSKSKIKPKPRLHDSKKKPRLKLNTATRPPKAKRRCIRQSKIRLRPSEGLNCVSSFSINRPAVLSEHVLEYATNISNNYVADHKTTSPFYRISEEDQEGIRSNTVRAMKAILKPSSTQPRVSIEKVVDSLDPDSDLQLPVPTIFASDLVNEIGKKKIDPQLENNFVKLVRDQWRSRNIDNRFSWLHDDQKQPDRHDVLVCQGPRTQGRSTKIIDVEPIVIEGDPFATVGLEYEDDEERSQ